MGGVQESNGSNTTVGPTRGGCRDSKMGQPLRRDRHPADTHGWTDTGPSENNLSAETTTSNNAEPTTHTSSSLTQHGTTKIPKPSNNTTHPKQTAIQQHMHRADQPTPENARHKPQPTHVTSDWDRGNANGKDAGDSMQPIHGLGSPEPLPKNDGRQGCI